MCTLLNVHCTYINKKIIIRLKNIKMNEVINVVTSGLVTIRSIDTTLCNVKVIEMYKWGVKRKRIYSNIKRWLAIYY